MRGQKLWLKVAAPRGEIKVYVTRTSPTDDEGNECHAIFDPETNTITIAVGPFETMKMKLFHELMHVAWSDASGDMREKVTGGKTADERGRREEMIISFQEPPLYDLLTRNGWLWFPKPPRFE